LVEREPTHKKVICYTAIVVKHTDKIEYLLIGLVFFSFLISVAPIVTGENFHLAPDFLNKAELKYGKEARLLLVAWEDIIINDSKLSDREKIERVNDFFNQMEFVDDIIHWGKNDYWATPIEFLGTKGGDCEDFSIAKYFTLKAMGIADEKLNLTYVKALNYNVHHMVLTYYTEPEAEPLVLDNLIGEIKPASQRKDLIPIYSFNGTGLWLAKQRGRGNLAGSSSRLQRWQDLIQRMSEDK
jgi:predicted transglutaminase-like cysteine proteinase